ncbi:unnamed protein product [Mytilus coruscus]|uniref:SH3 domain-containing protein n=1 Tax=Mytilus coruscus TaxID=42192 RepID=A0A6J8E705_MYTCO|nr:unnamed protein product [Mytilus coruscus]
MWVCRNCKEANDNKLNYCITCKIPKDVTEHEVVEDHKPDTDVIEGHLTLSKGDVITVLKKGDKIWRGKIGRQEGLFPKRCVEDKIRQIYRVITHYFDEQRDHLKVEENDVVTAINRTSNGFLWVQFQGQEGWIPETHLEKAITDKALVTSKIAPKSFFMHQETRKESIQYTLQRPCHWKKYEVLYDFKNEDCKYLELMEGDIIFVVGGEENGWFLAQIGYENGLVPATYVHLLENQDDDIYRVKALYSGEEIGNLNMQIGDIVNVVNRRTSGWVWVNHNETEGWYPENHLTHYDNTSETDDADEISEPNKQTLSGQNMDSIVHHGQGGVIMRRNTMMMGEGFSDELNSVPPPIPARRKSQATPIRNDLRELSQNTYGNTVIHDDQSSSKPPRLPERRKLQLPPTIAQSKNITQNVYGNSDPNLGEIKKETLKVMEYEEPKTTNKKKDTDAIKLDETDHVYDYITGNQKDKYMSNRLSTFATK